MALWHRLGCRARVAYDVRHMRVCNSTFGKVKQYVCEAEMYRFRVLEDFYINMGLDILRLSPKVGVNLGVIYT